MKSFSGCIPLVLLRLPKLPGPFTYHWLGNLGSLGSNKEIHPQLMPSTCNISHTFIVLLLSLCIASINQSINQSIPYTCNITHTFIVFCYHCVLHQSINQSVNQYPLPVTSPTFIVLLLSLYIACISISLTGTPFVLQHAVPWKSKLYFVPSHKYAFFATVCCMHIAREMSFYLLTKSITYIPNRATLRYCMRLL